MLPSTATPQIPSSTAITRAGVMPSANIKAPTTVATSGVVALKMAL